jgi:hypothetical protein
MLQFNSLIRLAADARAVKRNQGEEVQKLLLSE